MQRIPKCAVKQSGKFTIGRALGFARNYRFLLLDYASGS
jgi:hypothetical protein